MGDWNSPGKSFLERSSGGTSKSRDGASSHLDVEVGGVILGLGVPGSTGGEVSTTRSIRCSRLWGWRLCSFTMTWSRSNCHRRILPPTCRRVESTEIILVHITSERGVVAERSLMRRWRLVCSRVISPPERFTFERGFCSFWYMTQHFRRSRSDLMRLRSEARVDNSTTGGGVKPAVGDGRGVV